MLSELLFYIFRFLFKLCFFLFSFFRHKTKFRICCLTSLVFFSGFVFTWARACESRASFTNMFELSWRAFPDRMPLVKQSRLARVCGPRALIVNRVSWRGVLGRWRAF